MRAIDIIEKVKHKQPLNETEIQFMIKGYVANKIPDYQMSAFLMAIYFNDLTNQETALLTKEMMLSGDTLDLSEIEGIKVDKHSTGGVGDKTSLCVGPIVASLGVPVAKMSGRGLGHTGGTLDKLESIPGLQVAINEEDFIKQVNEIKLAIVGQSLNLDPADKKMYALRDVTGTVDSMPLIASSIMSKKLAAGADKILLDVKYGDGAFMKNIEDATKLANLMINIGESLNKETRATLSNMNQPLGYAIGNSLEVIEAIQTLKGQGPEDFTTLCIEEAETMLLMAGRFTTREEANQAILEVIENGKALDKLAEMVKMQHGDASYIYDTNLFTKTSNKLSVLSKQSGYVHELKALTLGLLSMKLGGGRENVDDEIDHSVGIIVHKKVGDYVQENEPLVTIYYNKDYENKENEVYEAYQIKPEKIDKLKLIEAHLGGHL